MVIQFLIIIYYIIPKIDLFYLPGSLTGIRVQDLIVFSLLCLRSAVPKVALKPILILGLCSFGNILSNLPLQFVLGSFRIIEYTILGFFIFEYIISEKKALKRFLIIIISCNFVISALQYGKVIPNFDPGRGNLISNEFSGLYGTPAELSYMCICLIYIMLIKGDFKLLKLKAMFPIFNGVLLGSIIILTLSPLLVVLRKLGQRAFTILMCMMLASLLFFVVVNFGIIVSDFVDVIINANPKLVDLKSSAMTVEGHQSLAQRLGKWANSVAYLIDNPLGLLFGVGVYSQGGALDGGILRLIFEFGVPISGYILYHIWKVDLRFLLLFVSVNLMFDAYMSSVVAPWLFGTYLFHLKRAR